MYNRLGKDKIHMKKAANIEEMLGVFEPVPLVEEEAFEEFYVSTYDARGNNAVKRMQFALKHSMNKFMKILFMGHRGSGKSTELSLLKKEISEQYEVVDYSIYEETDIENMTYIDLIFSVMSRLVKYVESHKSLKLKEKDIQALYDYWYQERVIETIDYDKAEMYAGYDAKLSFLRKIAIAGGGILKTGAESKTVIRQNMEPKIGYLIQLLDEIINKVNQQLQGKELLFIIGDLDKVNEKVAEDLFISHYQVLLSIKTKIIYTFPVYMAYNVKFNQIKESADVCQMLSIIKVRDRDKREYNTGINTLKEIVYRRADEKLIAEDALRYMILKSGGAIRDLFQMIRDAAFEALVMDRDKICMKDAQRAYTILKSEYERLIRREEDVQKLKEIYNDSKLLTTDDTMMSLLSRGLVLEYNGERWCGIHPAIEDFLIEKGELSVG